MNAASWPEVGCNLDPFVRNNEISIYNATYGFIQGLYSSEQYPVETGCFQCYRLATTLSRINKNAIILVDSREAYTGDWSRYNSIEQVTLLWDLYK
jgi:hypothetical protein